MDTASLESVSASPSRRTPARLLLAPFLALLLGGALLAAWLTAVSARDLEQPASPAAQDYPSLLTRLPDNQAGQAFIPPLAPLAAYDLAIQKTSSPSYFTIGSNNFYNIVVTRLNTETVPALINVTDQLPLGITWAPVSPINSWDCSASTSSVVNCDYTLSITGTNQIEPLQFKVNVAPDIGDSVVNTAYLNFGSTSKSSTILTSIRRPELGIEKTKSPQSFTVGGNNSYIINITRLNTEMVPSGFSVEDTLPTGMTITPTAMISNWDCSASTTQQLSCYYTKSITGTTLIDPLLFKVKVSSNILATVTNTAYLYYANRIKSSAIDTPISSADLILSKAQAPLLVPSVGTPVNYTLVITNNGPAVANNVILTETLPTYMQAFTVVSWSFKNAGPTPTGPVINGNVYQWTIDYLQRNNVATLVLSSTPQDVSSSDKASGKTITNKARVTSSNHDWVQLNNTAQTSFVVGGLDISKAVIVDQPTVYAGDSFIFSIAITNSTTSGSAINATVKDTFSNTIDITGCTIKYSVVARPDSSCLVSSRVLNSFISLSPTQVARYIITARGNNSILNSTNIINSATVTWGSPSFTLRSNSVELTINPGGALQIGKTDKLSTVEKSQLISYTVTITNIGSLSTDGGTIFVADTYSENLDVSYYVLNKNGLTIDVDPLAGNVRTFEIKDLTLSRGQVISFTLGAKVLPNPTGNRVINKVDVSANDSNSRGLTATAQDLDTIPTTDFTIEKTASKTQVYAGETFYYTITIKDVSGIAYNVNVNDNFSSYLDIASCRIKYPTDGTTTICNVANRALATFVSLSSTKHTALVIIGARGNSNVGTTFRNVANTATISWGSPIQSRTSNESDITIFPSGYLDVRKSDGVDTVYQGQTITYTVHITNVGSLATTANTLRVTDTFFSNVSYTGLNTNGLTMELVYNSGGVRAWNIKNKSLNAGEKISFYVGAKVASSPSTAYSVNLVSASARDTTNLLLPTVEAYDIDDISDSPIATLKYVKSVTPAQAKVGETFTFKIVLQNRGTNTLYNVTLSDIFPAQVDLVSATTSRGTATLSTSAREVEVVIASLSNDEAATIVIQAKVNTSVVTPKTLRNRAELSWNGSDTILSNAVAYRVLASGSLPGTGLEPQAALAAQAAGWSAALSPVLGGLAGLAGALGLALLVYSLWARSRRPLYAGRYLRGGLGLLALAALIGLSALLTRPGEVAGNQVAGLSGEKPPLATSLETPVVPTASPAATQPAAEYTPPPLSGGQTELRPTQDPRLPTPEPVQPTPTLTHGEVDISYLLPTATPVDLPQYDIPIPTLMPLTGPDGGSPDSSAVTRLVIPKMGLDTVVKYVPFSGSTWLISGLKQEIAWMGDTSWPGLGSNTGLAGHVDLVTGAKGPFWNLKELKTGDEVLVYTETNIYSYRVRQQTVVEDYDLSVIEQTEKPQVTLITCTTWDPDLRMYTRRLVIFADLAGVRPR